MTTLDRLKIELNQKPYYDDKIFSMYLSENELDPDGEYNKTTMQRGLYGAVLDVLQSLANDIDLFRKTETEFVSTGEAYKYLQRRLDDVKNRIAAIPDAGESRTDWCFPFIG